MNIKLSVVVPVYNIEDKLLKSCFGSLYNQTIKNIEFIIVDDGSKSACSKICDDFAKMDARAKVIHQHNAGVSAARNAGIQASHGDYIIFVDADDQLVKDCCGYFCSIMDSNDFDIMIFQYRCQSKLKSIEQYTEFPKTYELHVLKDWEVKKCICSIIDRIDNKDGFSLGAPWGKLFRRDFLLSNDLDFVIGLEKSQDRVFILSCFNKMPKISFLNVIGYFYNNTNMCSVCHKYNPNILSTLEMMDNEMVKIVSIRYKQDEKVLLALYKMRLQNILEYLHLCEFHLENSCSVFKKAKSIKDVIGKEKYSCALNEIKGRNLIGFSKNKRIKLFFLRHKLVLIYVCIFSMGKKLKSMGMRN